MNNKIITLLLLSGIVIIVFVSGCVYAYYFWERKYDLTEAKCYEFCISLIKDDIRSCDREFYHQNETHGLCVCKCMKSGFGLPSKGD